MPAKLIVRNLRKRYGQVEAARGVSFEVREGEVFGLIGSNGAGKTTTLECVVGLREADAGEIEVCGIDARSRPGEVKQRIGAALQFTALQDRITPREALELFGSFYRDPADPGQLLRRFSLLDRADAPFASLSGGQRQRLALALAFVNRPELIFLDEPTAGLDPRSRRDLHDEIERMRREGHTVLLTTHHLEEAERLCDRVAVIDRGRIIATGTPRELISRSSAAPTVLLETDPPLGLELLASIHGVQEPRIEGGSARFRAPDVRRTLAELMRLLDEREAELVQLHVTKATLEDVFLELTGTAPRD